MRFAVVGPGKVGTALAELLSRAGHDFIGAAGRNLDSAQRACAFVGGGHATTDPGEVTGAADLALLTVPDDAILQMCAELAGAGAFPEGSVVAHCSGALPSSVLRPAADAGAHVGSLHPMQSFASAEQAVRTLPGSACCVEGDPDAVRVLTNVARDLGCHVIAIPTERKALYHAAGCVASNYLVALQNAALKLNRAAGMGAADALRIMMPLLKGTVDNLQKVGLPDCLTGPIARGDVQTVRRHLDAIGEFVPDLLPLYRVMGRETVEVARAKGTLAGAAADQLLELLG